MNIKPVQLIINELKNSIIHKHFNYPVINHMMSTLYNFSGSLVFFINNVSSLISISYSHGAKRRIWSHVKHLNSRFIIPHLTLNPPSRALNMLVFISNMTKDNRSTAFELDK